MPLPAAAAASAWALIRVVWQSRSHGEGDDVCSGGDVFAGESDDGAFTVLQTAALAAAVRSSETRTPASTCVGGWMGGWVDVGGWILCVCACLCAMCMSLPVCMARREGWSNG